MSEDMSVGQPQESSERVFAPLPPTQGRSFSRSWWGVRWQKTLEATVLDSEQLRRGRRYARSGAVGAMSLRPGRITAMVREGDGTAHRADVLVPQLDEPGWERLLAVTARTAGHLAALLDGEMTPELVEDAEAVQVSLLPEMGDLQADCDCGEWDHCPHTVAVCYQLARLLDEDPLILLLLLGRDKERLIEDLHRLSFAQAVHELPADEGLLSTHQVDETGVGALQTYQAAKTAEYPLPDPPPLVETAPDFPQLREDGAPPTGLDPHALELLLRDTAARAAELLTEALKPEHATSSTPPRLSQWADAVRLAAVLPLSQERRRTLAGGCGRQPAELERATSAWRFGSEAGLHALEAPADATDPFTLARARDVIAGAWDEGEIQPRFVAEGNRWTAYDHGVQLRYATDGRWWPFLRDHDTWLPAGPAGHDPSVLLAELGCP